MTATPKENLGHRPIEAVAVIGHLEMPDGTAGAADALDQRARLSRLNADVMSTVIHEQRDANACARFGRGRYTGAKRWPAADLAAFVSGCFGGS